MNLMLGAESGEAVRCGAWLGITVVSWWAWPMMVLMVSAVVVAWNCCPSPAERWRARLLLMLVLLAIAMNAAVGYRLKSVGLWAQSAEERLRRLERESSSQSNHETAQGAKQ